MLQDLIKLCGWEKVIIVPLQNVGTFGSKCKYPACEDMKFWNFLIRVTHFSGGVAY